MVMSFCCRMMCLAALLFALVVCESGNANAQARCPDNERRSANCTKEIRIWNNTPSTIYAVLQGVPQRTDALNCPVNPKGGGDVWLQRALGDINKCFKVDNDYYVFINPTKGIAAKSFASINVPWWSKRLPGAPDTFVDWWRGGRVIIFDDQTALNDSFNILKSTAQVKWAAGTPVPSCKNLNGNACLPGELQIYQVPPKAIFGTKTPFQLSEFTFASVDKVTGGGTGGGKFLNFNQNYNVSNVDQIYLPIAIGPVRNPPDIGYMGTTMPVTDFRTTLSAFTNPAGSPVYWPIYNNPVSKGKRTYPNAGIRVPSAQTVFNYYMNPFSFPPPLNAPQIIPASPPAGIVNMMNQWKDCVAGKATCPQSAIYKKINSTFADSYAFYIDPVNKCTIPPFLKPVPGTNPPAPKLTAYLTPVYGWVPFEQGCPGPVPELPIAREDRTPIDYINIQYNYLNTALATRWFNPYTRLIHASLKANAYAFSIDDQSSFLSNSGGTLPGGLIIAVGGATGLPNGKQVPPPLPPYYPKFDFVVALGPPAPAGGARWAKYGICSTVANKVFPGSGNGAYAFGVDPAVKKFPCTITFTDTKSRTYQIQILKAAVPPAQIWPKFMPRDKVIFDKNVVSCPASTGVVPPKDWCNFTNEVADPTIDPVTKAPFYSLSASSPLK